MERGGVSGQPRHRVGPFYPRDTSCGVPGESPTLATAPPGDEVQDGGLRPPSQTPEPDGLRKAPVPNPTPDSGLRDAQDFRAVLDAQEAVFFVHHGFPVLETKKARHPREGIRALFTDSVGMDAVAGHAPPGRPTAGIRT